MLYLTLKPMMTTIGWAWSGYKSSQELLEQSRDFQMQLQQTLKDLEDVNMQLTRLNKQAHTLRIIAEEERATKERFVANVSHELRTPLYMIIGFCEMITQSPETYGQDIPEALLADLAVVLRNSQHLQSLIDDVLDLSQIEAGHMALRKERISIAEIIQAATIAIKPLFTSKGLYLKTEIIPDLPPLFCDRTRIREVLLNLLSNAGRFTERGGVCVRAWQEDNTIIISVADTGPGILASEQAKLFQPFHQLDNAVRPKYGSSGLGLSISRSFVELHSGKMWVESTLGSGATFFFRLPIEPVDTLEPGPSTYLVSGWEFLQRTHRSLAPVPNISPRVVIVEKGTALLHLIRRYMDQVEIIHVADIDQALVELSNVPSQALLVNDVNNTQPLQRLVADRNLPPFVPAIICSIPEVEDTAVELGVIDYLVKPVSAEKLFTILDKFGEQEIQTILVVDDEPDVLRLFARVLTEGKRPYRVLRASNGREALEILTQERVDLIFLDLIMPEIDGYQFLILKNTDPHLKTIPSIVVTAQNPFSQPMTCNALTVTCRDGLTASQILDLVEAIRQIFVRAGSPDGQASVKVNSG